MTNGSKRAWRWVLACLLVLTVYAISPAAAICAGIVVAITTRMKQLREQHERDIQQRERGVLSEHSEER